SLARDIERYLSDEPVQACPPSAMYRFRKFTRRQKATLVTVAMVVAALMLGIVGTTWQAIQATQERDRAVAAEGLAQTRLDAEPNAREEAGRQQAEADKERRRAETNLKQTREAVDRFFTRAAEELADKPHMEKVRRALLTDALNFYQGFLEQKGTDPLIKHE